MNENREKRFAFGKNWKNFIVKSYNVNTYKQAERSMLKFLDGYELKNKSFLDVGCGSGIHSLVAARNGSTSIVSIDYDQDSVECTQSLVKVEGNSYPWKVRQGSVLDEKFMKSLGIFDLVYCWGVAHHTGDMWSALDNLTRNVKPGGLLFVAIYNTVPGLLGSRYWHRVKKFYCSLPRPAQVVMEWIYLTIHILRLLLLFKNPFRVMRQYKDKRGMSYRHDLNDWLGGFPYEHAKSEELFRFYRDRGFVLLNLKTSNSIGNNQLLLQKKV